MPVQKGRSDSVGSVGTTQAESSSSSSSSSSHEKEILDSWRVPSSLLEIAPILYVANEFEPYYPRVAYICRKYASEKAHTLDPNSSGHGVRKFKTSLSQWLIKHNERTKKKRETKSDTLEMQRVYEEYHDYIHDLLKISSSSQLTKQWQSAEVLYVVLQDVHKREKASVSDTISKLHNEVEGNNQIYVPYNILPLHPDSENQVIMGFPEVKAAVMALRNMSDLKWPEDHKNKRDIDMLDWLQTIFGFQNDNVSNQREHLILLLANVQSRKADNVQQEPILEDTTLDTVMLKLLKNYTKWCKYMGKEANINNWLVEKDVKKRQQRKLLCTGLYLLIWGEAANLRFMPECLCYIYHHMALELKNMLEGEIIKPAYGGEDEAFLKKLVTPIYKTIYTEAKKNKRGKHSEWRNYDDLNEYFWSSLCFDQLKWPMKLDADFFCKTDQGDEKKPNIGKINFVEIRSFWQIFRSFNRMWSFYILSLQAMVIIAWNESEKTYGEIFRKVTSVFITAAILKLAQAVIDITLSWKTRHSMTKYVKLRYILKAVAAVVWVVLMPIIYANSHTSQLYVLAILIYLFPNILSTLLFFFPFIRCCLEKSNFKIVVMLMWWCQPHELYIGRGMHEGAMSLFKYTVFWIVLLVSKFTFSYYLEIKPLVGPTKDILRVYISANYLPPLFPHAKNNIGVVITLWSPVILVYFMDTQVWYAIMSTLIGGFYGAFQHLGEVQTLGMLRSRFQSLPGAFNSCLVPAVNNSYSDPVVNNSCLVQAVNKWKNGIQLAFSRKVHEIPDYKSKEAKLFTQMWNTIISSFREEDLISDWEMELMLVPHWDEPDMKFVRWPPFLLASKITIAMNITKDWNEKDCELKKRLDIDDYMTDVVRECYASFKDILISLVMGERSLRVINEIFSTIDKYLETETLVKKVNLSALPDLYDQLVQLTTFLIKDKEEDKDQIVTALMKMIELVTKDMMEEDIPSLEESDSHSQDILFKELQLPVSSHMIAGKEKIKRLHHLLTVKGSAMDVPSALEARRRLTFFSNSLFMDMPLAPKVREMVSFSALTPYCSEDVLYPIDSLGEPNDDGISILFYLQKNFPDEWKSFLERVDCGSERELVERDDLKEKISLWASYRGQTLTKTVRGMMYYRMALELQAFFDLANDEELGKGYKALGLESSLLAQCQAHADMKFTYVVACQHYSNHKISGDQRAKDILRLMTTYPSLRVAYIDEVEQIHKGTVEKIYYSALVKAAPQANPLDPKLTDPQQREKTLDQVIYKIKLPGLPIIGEGKPENQNHSIIFTRGEGLQTIDMNQDYYIEEAFKMRNLLQEFHEKHGGIRYPTILGLREHIFTRSVSSLAWFMSNQEHSFVTIGQRVLASPLKVRFHYGHPDVFDRLFHITRGGISKASKTINLSEDIFAGFNSTLREGNVTHHEYIQVGKGRDVGLNQISLFEAKIANGNGEQTLSRDLYRLGHQFDFFRMLSCYFTTVGFYFCAMLTVLTVYVFLYGRMYLALSDLGKVLRNELATHKLDSLQTALASQSFVQIGFLMALPMIMEIGLERGFHKALVDFIWMQLQLASVFYTFQLGTKFHYYCKTLLHGGAEYKGTGRGFVVLHAKFAENYRFYSRSHFIKAFELMILLVVSHIFGTPYVGWISISIWFMVGTWLFAPFLFNPSGFEWHKIVDDWKDWKKWILKYDNWGIGVPPEKSWESWWEKEHEYLRHSGKLGIFVEIVLALRFFIFQYGLVYHLSTFKHKHLFWVYPASWSLILIIIFFVTVLGMARQRLGKNAQFAFRIIKVSLFFTVLAVPIICIAYRVMTLKDVCLCMLALIPTGWGLLLIAQASKPLFQSLGLWSSVKVLAWSYDLLMGFLLFIPVSLLAWFPFVSDFQTRMLFNPAFSQGLQISHILGGQNIMGLPRNED